MMPKLVRGVLAVATALALNLNLALARPPTEPQLVLGSHAGSGAFSLDSPRLVQLSSNPLDTKWMTEAEKLALRASGTYLIDITDTPSLRDLVATAERQSFEYPKPNSTLVDQLIPHLSKTNLGTNLAVLTALYTRYYNSDTGLAASHFLLKTLTAYAQRGLSDDRVVFVTPVYHDFKQFSITVRIADKSATEADPIAVIGAHIDSLNKEGPFKRAPGADDDGSGTVTILEAVRVILASGHVPKSPIEFHFYAGEEGGLLGSQHIVASYAKRTNPVVSVKGMLQLDMTAWVTNGTGNGHVGITINHSNRALAEFNKLLVDRYLTIPWVDEPNYPWGASDSFSWDEAGYPASDALESTWLESRGHRGTHTPEDHQFHPEFSFDHMLEYSKLAVGFAIELGNSD